MGWKLWWCHPYGRAHEQGSATPPIPSGPSLRRSRQTIDRDSHSYARRTTHCTYPSFGCVTHGANHGVLVQMRLLRAVFFLLKDGTCHYTAEQMAWRCNVIRTVEDSFRSRFQHLGARNVLLRREVYKNDQHSSASDGARPTSERECNSHRAGNGEKSRQ